MAVCGQKGAAARGTISSIMMKRCLRCPYQYGGKGFISRVEGCLREARRQGDNTLHVR